MKSNFTRSVAHCIILILLYYYYSILLYIKWTKTICIKNKYCTYDNKYKGQIIHRTINAQCHVTVESTPVMTPILTLLMHMFMFTSLLVPYT